MSAAEIGALAAAVAVACALLAPHRMPSLPMCSIGHPDAAALAEVGWTRGLVAWEVIRFACVGGAFVCAAAVGIGPLAAAAAIAPSMALRAHVARRSERAGRETIVVLQMTHAALRSGAAVPEALRVAIGASDDVAARPFVAALRAFDLGEPLDRALRSESARAGDPRAVLALDAVALGVGEQLPASRCAAVVGGALDRLVFEQRLADDVRARTSGLRLQVILLAALVPCLALYLVLTMPGLAQTLGTPLGRFVLVPLALGLEIVGIVASRRAVRGISS